MLCCDDCSGTYHLKCLDPPLKSAPKGHWSCPACVNPIADVERIIAGRCASAAAGPSAAAGDGAEHNEFLIKWKEKSYRKCTWVKLQELVAAGRQFPGLQARLRNFQARSPHSTRSSSCAHLTPDPARLLRAFSAQLAAAATLLGALAGAWKHPSGHKLHLIPAGPKSGQPASIASPRIQRL